MHDVLLKSFVIASLRSLFRQIVQGSSRTHIFHRASERGSVCVHAGAHMVRACVRTSCVCCVGSCAGAGEEELTRSCSACWPTLGERTGVKASAGINYTIII